MNASTGLPKHVENTDEKTLTFFRGDHRETAIDISFQKATHTLVLAAYNRETGDPQPRSDVELTTEEFTMFKAFINSL